MGHSVRIEITQPGRGQVWVDGVKVPRVRSVRASAAIDEPNLVTIELVPDHISLRMRAQARLKVVGGLDEWLTYNERSCR